MTSAKTVLGFDGNLLSVSHESEMQDIFVNGNLPYFSRRETWNVLSFSCSVNVSPTFPNIITYEARIELLVRRSSVVCFLCTHQAKCDARGRTGISLKWLFSLKHDPHPLWPALPPPPPKKIPALLIRRKALVPFGQAQAGMVNSVFQYFFI